MHNPRPWEIVGGRNERAKRILARGVYAAENENTRGREEEAARIGSGRRMERREERERIHLVSHRMHTCVTVFHDQEKSRKMRSCDRSESWNQRDHCIRIFFMDGIWKAF